MGKVLHANLGPPSASALAGVHPAALRALGETAIPQVREYYTPSLDYGRNTMPEEGLVYLGTAQAERDLVALCRSSPPLPRSTRRRCGRCTPRSKRCNRSCSRGTGRRPRWTSMAPSSPPTRR